MKREASTHSDTITSQPRRHDQSVNTTRESGGRLQLSRKQDSNLADQSKTVLRCIWECSWQILVRRATESPLRPKIGTARRAENIPSLSCIVRAHPQVYFTSYIVNDVSSRPILLYGRKNKATRNSGKRFLGNAKWRQTTQSTHNKYLRFLCMCKKTSNMAAQQVQAYLERHRIGALFEVTIIWFKLILMS